MVKLDEIKEWLKGLGSVHGFIVKRYRHDLRKLGQIEGGAIIFVLLSLVGYFILYFAPLSVINKAISFAGGSAGTMPKVINKTYSEAKEALITNGYQTIDPIAEQPQYLFEPNAVVTRQSPTPGPIYESDTEVKLTVEVKQPKLGLYSLDRGLEVKDARRIRQTQIQLSGLEILEKNNRRSARTYLKVTNFSDFPIALPALNNAGRIATGVVFEDNNSVNGIGYGVEDFGTVAPSQARWGISRPLTIKPHSSVLIFIQFGGVREKAGEYRLSLNFGDYFTDFGTIDRIRLSDGQN